MRIIPEHELAPDDNPCEDCNRIRVKPVTITDAEWDEIFAGYFLQFENSRYTSEGVIHITANQFSQYIKALISLTGEGK